MDTADPMVEPGKVFVGGLSWDTTDETFKKHFEQFGEVSEIKIMKEHTGKPRGFGFVTYRDPNSVPRVLSEKEHKLDGKKIDPKPATNNKDNRSNATDCRVFLGGLPFNCGEDEITFACSQFGQVNTVDIKSNGEKQRGFAFVDFAEKSCVQKICEQHFITINDKRVEVKKAEPRTKGTTTVPQQQPPTLQQGYPNLYYSMGRGMSGATAGHFYGTHYPPYNTYGGQQYPSPGQYQFASQQVMSSFPDTTAGGYSQGRSSFGSGTTDQYNGGAATYNGYEHHLGYSSYPADQSGSMNYNDHAAATSQQRSGYTFGRN